MKRLDSQVTLAFVNSQPSFQKQNWSIEKDNVPGQWFAINFFSVKCHYAKLLQAIFICITLLKPFLFFIGEEYSCPKQDEHKQAFTGSQRKMLSHSCRGKMHCLAVIYSVVTDILYSSTMRFGFRTQAYVESCPGFLRFLSRDIIFYLNHKLDRGKHKSCAFFAFDFHFSVTDTCPKGVRTRSIKQLCNVYYGMLRAHLDFSASPSKTQPKETTWNPKNMATCQLEIIGIQSLEIKMRVGDTEDFCGSHENPLPILVLRVEFKPQPLTVAPLRMASTDMAQLLLPALY